MNENTTTYREKGRALFLTAIMVLSVVAMAASFGAAPAAAVSSGDDIDLVDVSKNVTTTNDVATYTVELEANQSSGVSSVDFVNASLSTGDNFDLNNVALSDITLNYSDGSISAGAVDVNDGADEINVSLSSTLTTFADTETIKLEVDAIGNAQSPGNYQLDAVVADSTDESEVVTAQHTVDSSLVVTNLDAPRVAPDDEDVDVTATIENQGESDTSFDLNFTADGGSSAVKAGNGETELLTLTGQSLDAGNSTTLTITNNTLSDYDPVNANSYNYSEDFFHGLNINDSNTNVQEDGVSAPFLIGGSDQRGAVTAEISDTDGFVVENAEVKLYVSSVAPSNLLATKTADGGPDNNRIRFDGTNTPNGLTIGSSGNSVEYIVVANKTGFEADNRAAQLDENNVEETVFPELLRLINADDISIDKTPSNGVVDLDGTITDDVTVFTDDEVANPTDPLGNTEVNVTIIDSNTDEFGSAVEDADLEINPNPPAQTASDGTVEFDISLDQSNITQEDIDGDVDFTLEFEATENGDGPEVTQTQNITFQGEPPSGDGTISGEVDVFDEDVQLGTANAEASQGTNVHAVQLDRAEDNTIGGTIESLGPLLASTNNATLNVTAGGNESVRVIEWNTSSSSVVEVLDVETDYLFKSNDLSVSQNLSIPGTGFDAEETQGTNPGEYAVTVLESDEDLPEDHTYAVEVSGDGNFTSPNTQVPFDAPNDLTYDAIENRYSNVPAEPTDTTDVHGNFNLLNLYTNGEVGLEYVVIASDGNADLGFANANGYDIIDPVKQSADPNDEQNNVALGVQAVDVQPNEADVTNVGTHPPLSETGGAPDFSEVTPFGDQSDDTRQEVPRDGETIDVIKVDTGVNGDALGAEATVSYQVTNGSFDGKFANLSVGGDVLNRGADNETLTIDTSVDATNAGEGTAYVFLVTDEAGLGDDANVTINVELNEGDTANDNASDGTDKLFRGVLDQEYDSASITGVVADGNDNPVDAIIYVSELNDPEAGLTITFEPDDVDQLDQFTATVTDDSTNTVLETVTVTDDDMRAFEFQNFDSNLTVKGEPFELLADRAADRTTLDPVPAINDTGSGLVAHALTGVSETGQTGTSKAETVEVDRTSTASIVISGVSEAFFDVSDLDPTDATITQGDDLTVSANITNEGDLSGEKDVTLSVENSSGAVTDLATQTVNLDAGETASVTFDLTDVQLPADDYTHSISTEDDSAEGNLTIEENTTNGDQRDLQFYQEYDGSSDTVNIGGFNQALQDLIDGVIDAGLFNDVLQDFIN
jgi:surface glycoprotein (TIGR04207 family)